jgi:PAS domain S-box-containing protein
VLRKLSKLLSSSNSLLVVSVVLLLAFGGLFYADSAVKKNAERLHVLTVNAERILNADRAGTAAVRLAASLESERFVLNYQDIQDSKYSLLEENLKYLENEKVRQALGKMEEIQSDIEDAETDAIGLIDEENWEEALELVTEPAFRRQKGMYRSHLSTALREMIQASQTQADQSAMLSKYTQYGVLGTFLLLALIGFLYSREIQRSLRRQLELAENLEDANENLEQRVRDRTAELKDSQALFKTVLDNMPAVVFLKDLKGQFQIINSRYEEIYGVSFEDAKGNTLFDVFDKELAEELTAVDLKVIYSSKVVETEQTSLVDDKEVILTSVLFPTLNKDGEVTGIGGIQIDVTERKQAEKELAEKEAQLRTALDNMSDGIFVLDPEHNYTIFNDRYLDYVELPEGAATIGGAVFKAILAHAERGDYGQGDPAELARNRLEKLSSDQSAETEMLVDGGKRVLSLRKAPLENGGAVVVLSDITERKEAEQQLAREKEIVDVTLEAMDQGITMIDGDLTMMACNKKFNELLELPEDVISTGATLESAFRYNAERGEYGDEDVEEAIRMRMELSRKFEAHQFERTRPDGVVLEIRGNPLANQKGFVTTYTDITERKQAEQELRGAYEVISSSISYASRIQRSILPEEGMMAAVLSDYFVIWEPRDVVGGDIYWAGAWGSGFLLVLGDCTGHGVPGAFMTLISMGALERARSEIEGGDVGALLARMHQFVQITLSQHYAGGESDDGIELGACYFVPDEPEMTFSGARFELIISDGEEVTTVKGTRAGAGYRGIPYDQVYAETKIEMNPHQNFYLSTDGLIDQIGGEKRRAYGKRRFRELIRTMHDQPFEEQKQKILETLKDYQGPENRRDDVSLIGFKI